MHHLGLDEHIADNEEWPYGMAHMPPTSFFFRSQSRETATALSTVLLKLICVCLLADDWFSRAYYKKTHERVEALNYFSNEQFGRGIHSARSKHHTTKSTASESSLCDLEAST